MLWKLRVFWDRLELGAVVFFAVAALVIGSLAAAMLGVFAERDAREQRARELDERNVACLARNVYFEARGEPMAGQYAVAEVTMNRRASGRYPDTICGVVYQQNWDPLRKRYVGAFSWTELSSVPAPMGEEWQRAWKVAETVYHGRQAPVLEDALFYHASYVKPSWAKGKQPIARIGRHVFYNEATTASRPQRG